MRTKTCPEKLHPSCSRYDWTICKTTASLHEAVRGHSWISIADSQVHDLAHTHSLVSFQLFLCQDPALMKRKSALVTIWHHIQPLRGITKCKVRRVRNGYTMEDIACLFACCAEYLYHVIQAKNYVYISWSKQGSCEVHAYVCHCNTKWPWWQSILYQIHMQALICQAREWKQTPFFFSSANLELLHKQLKALKLPWLNHFLS